jgi:DNA-directed RNA polymerase alpha subunit
VRLKVNGNEPVLVGHTWRLPGEIFEISEAAGRVALARRPEALAVDAEPSLQMRSDSDEEEIAGPEVEGGAPVEDLGLSDRVLDALDANGIHSTARLRDFSDDALLNLHGIGPRALEEIREALGRE